MNVEFEHVFDGKVKLGDGHQIDFHKVENVIINLVEKKAQKIRDNGCCGVVVDLAVMTGVCSIF